MTHDEHREALGAYVLDALEPWENRRVEEHLMSCADCQHEFTELSAVPVLLAQLPTSAILERYADEDLAEVTPLPTPEPAPEPVTEPAPEPAAKPAAKPAVLRPRRPRRRLPVRVRRPLTIGIAASVLVGGLTAGAVAVALTGSGKPTPGPTASASATVTRELTGSNLSNASHGRATLSTVGPNTEIYVSVSGLTPGGLYQWYVVNAAGSKQTLGSFTVPHDEYTGPANTQALTAVGLKDIASIEIDDASGQVVLTLTP